MSSKKRSTTTKKQARKPLAKPEFNINHPELADKIELAFTSGGRKYYRFISEYQMPTGRYKWVMNYLREVDLRMDLATMKAYMAEIIKCIDGSKKQIDLINVFKVVTAIQSRLELAFEPETIKRLASVTYFDDSEDLSDFNMAKGEEKRKWWDKHNTLDFFLTSPIGELLGMKGISLESLQVYIQETTEILKELTSPAQQSSPGDISENGKKTSSTLQTETPI